MDSKEIKIRQLVESDKSQLAILANNNNISNNLRDYFPSPYDEEDAKSFIKMTIQQDPTVSFGIEFRGEFCGVISLILQDDMYRKSAEIGYWLGEPYWGKGITTKAVDQITKYGFEKLNLIRIYAGVIEYNTASMSVLEKSGFKKEGISQKAIIKNGKIWNEHRYYILNEKV
ncbi:RimJ/RimL family protein N-acetyltransferase [Aquimarina sp. EL_43]|uniref:GNAT family N-acetyltransferase n=1 Tax=unclassified Aquimarina TaxID=2627091 RepID=UPI0018CB79F0|nr:MULTISPECIES: GNAT family protein [unclassified Aquimarina]MBG6128893.1 RimJ/RimL family protein N-acetyltransferase [Aquimarina sp. EL_35]MBG6149957.1 RimJ/RimL family protein N-acetyltransferase [Aquimarina sp. EL_32]MBG6167356.1 RimJ/RimL family protein N-acetyltransferase [Aquimarina sp. EL_43]